MNLELVHMPVYTGISLSVLMIIQLVLMGRVIAQRGQSEVLIGTAGVDALEQRVRVHANFLENVPTFIVGLAIIEMIAGQTVWVALLAAFFVASRLAHAIGFSMSAGVTMGRLLGTLGSMIATLVAAAYLAYLALGQL